MGQLHSINKQNYSLHYAEYHNIGERDYMEDTIAIDLALGTKKKYKNRKSLKNLTVQTAPAVFGLFDGHSGSLCSEYVSKHILSTLFLNRHFPEDVVNALSDTFMDVDVEFLKLAKRKKSRAGSTGIVCVIIGQMLYVANVGDSRGVMCRDGECVSLSEDHKPDSPSERKRIEMAGGTVDLCGDTYRINKKLSVSRGFGDYQFKNQVYIFFDVQETLREHITTSEPDIRVFLIDSSIEFIFLACDGIWDVMSSEEVVVFLRRKIKQYREHRSDLMKTYNDDLYYACVDLCYEAHSKGSTDNISCILIAVRNSLDPVIVDIDLEMQNADELEETSL